MVIFNRYKIVTAGFEKASKKLIHTGLREIGSFTCLSAELTGQKWTVNVQLLQYLDIVGVFFCIMSVT